MSPETQLSLKHLEAEFARVDLLLHRAMRRWRLAGQNPADDFRGLYIADAEAQALLTRPLGTNWGQTVNLAEEDAQAYVAALAKAAEVVEAIEQQANRAGQVLRFGRLARLFGLNRFERDTLLICLAPSLDLRYERLYGYLQDDITRKRPTINLVLDLLCEPGPERLLNAARFTAESPLFKYQFLELTTEASVGKSSWLGQNLILDEAIVAWLLGQYQSPVVLGPHAALVTPRADEAAPLLAPTVTALLARAETDALIAFHGPDRAAQLAAAQSLAARLNRQLFTLNLAALAHDEQPPAVNIIRLALRDARLNDALPYLSGWDACLRETAPVPELLAEVCAHPDWVILAASKPWQLAGVERERNALWVEFPIPDYQQRRALWRRFLEGDAAQLNVDELSGQFLLTTAQIRDAVASARDLAAQRGSPLQGADLFAAARSHSSSGLSTLARKIVPRYDWVDIILPPDQVSILREIIATVRGRPVVLDDWGLGRKLASSNGVTVLFAGQPGTGKTMAAEVLAGELGLELYKIDLSTVVSKYIGETEKNLEKIFHVAESSNAILFFDEADAIFGKRSEVQDSHDRYANIEISYLLQRMEAYDGVTILATNLRANLDEAFTRRLQFAVDFPFPEEADRLRIWESLFPKNVPHKPNLDLALLARRFKLAGGSIRNIIVNAAFLAAANGGQITMDHLLHGTRRELQKMGRLLSDKDLTVG